MGGQINMAFRFSDGEACCFDRWTNNIGVLSKLEILEGDEAPVREYINMCRNNDYVVDHSYNGKPVKVSTSGYGLVLIDYLTKTIIDCNGYTTLFGDIQAFMIRDHEDDWYSRHYNLIRDSLKSGRGVIEKAYPAKPRGSAPIITRYDNISALPDIMQKADQDRKYDDSHHYYIYDIDTAPWSYHTMMGDAPKERNLALSIARKIGFPMTRKEGLNANYPYPRKKKATEAEIHARFIWMKMKELENYKEFDGTPWDDLSVDTKNELLEIGRKLTPQEYNNMRLQEFVSATTSTITISL